MTGRRASANRGPPLGAARRGRRLPARARRPRGLRHKSVAFPPPPGSMQLSPRPSPRRTACAETSERLSALIGRQLSRFRSAMHSPAPRRTGRPARHVADAPARARRAVPRPPSPPSHPEHRHRRPRRRGQDQPHRTAALRYRRHRPARQRRRRRHPYRHRRAGAAARHHHPLGRRRLRRRRCPGQPHRHSRPRRLHRRGRACPGRARRRRAAALRGGGRPGRHADPDEDTAAAAAADAALRQQDRPAGCAR